MNFPTRFIFSCLVFCLSIHTVYADVYVDEQSAESGEIRLSNVPVEESYKVLITEPEKVQQPVQAASAKPAKPLPYDDLVTKAALATQLAPALIHAVIAVESQHNAMAVSARGAIGLMQLMPGTARDFQVNNPYNPRQNILGGARYLKSLLQLFEGDISLALAAYNAGPEKVKRYGMRIPPFAETQAYVTRVLSQYQTTY